MFWLQNFVTEFNTANFLNSNKSEAKKLKINRKNLQIRVVTYKRTSI